MTESLRFCEIGLILIIWIMEGFVCISPSQFFTSFHIFQTNADEDYVTILGK